MNDGEGVKIPFQDLPRETEAPGIASHAQEVDGVRWAKVHYEPGVLREEWCDEGHSGFVLEGSVRYEFQEGEDELELSAGEAFALADGSAHRGQAGPDGAVLFVIDRAGV